MRRLLLVTLLVFIASALMSQQDDAGVNISRSTDKVKIEGKYYYIHIVGQNETLYSISKAYNVSQIEIAMENPDIYLGLQVDQALKIPIKDQEILSTDEDENYIYHVVRRKETLFGLAKKYQISMQDIIATNPEVEEGLKTNQVVLIPKKQIETLGNVSPQESEQFIYHEVKPREGFFAISKKYGVNEEIIRRFNPDLVKDGIKLGTVLKIPRNPIDTSFTPEPNYTQSTTDVDKLDADHITPSVVCDTFVYNRWRDKFNIALLMPFTQKVSDFTIDEKDEGSNGNKDPEYQQEEPIKITPHTANFLDFYQGALLAIDSLKQLGLSINLNVFDTEKDAIKAQELTLEPGVRDAHLIIGPAYQECLKPIANFALEERIPLVSPLSPNNFLLERNPYLFQINPSFLSQLEEFTQMIDLCSGQNFILIHEGDSTNIGMIDSFKEMLGKRISECSTPELIHFKEVIYKPGSAATEVQEQISHSLVFDRENFLIVPSNNEAFVSDLLGNLHTLLTIYKYPIKVYGFPRWQKFRNIQVDYYYQLQLQLFTPFYIDYNSSRVKSFIAKYRDLYRSEPSQYSFQGFDVVFFFLSAMKSYGIDFQYCLPNHNNKLLQSNYHFHKVNSLSGYENRSIYLIQYTKDFDIIEVDSCIDNQQKVIPAKYINEPDSNRIEAIVPK